MGICHVVAANPKRPHQPGFNPDCMLLLSGYLSNIICLQTQLSIAPRGSSFKAITQETAIFDGACFLLTRPYLEFLFCGFRVTRKDNSVPQTRHPLSYSSQHRGSLHYLTVRVFLSRWTIFFLRVIVIYYIQRHVSLT